MEAGAKYLQAARNVELLLQISRYIEQINCAKGSHRSTHNRAMGETVFGYGAEFFLDLRPQLRLETRMDAAEVDGNRRLC